MKATSLPFVCLALTSLASAQSFNLDFQQDDTCMGTPSFSYGGVGTQQIGFWDRIDASVVLPVAIDDLSGTQTNVMLNVTSGVVGECASSAFDCSNWSDGDKRMYRDSMRVPGGTTTSVEVLGLSVGSYIVFSYCHGEGSPTDVSVLGSPDPTTTVGATCPGSQAHGNPETYTTHRVTISLTPTGTTPLIIDLWAPNGSYGNLSALQIMALGQPTLLGTNGCIGAINSTGAGAAISAIGTPLPALPGEPLIAAKDLMLTAAPVPAGQPGLFFMGTGQQQVPYLNGFLCVTAPVIRFPVVTSDVTGTMRMTMNYASPQGSSILPGSTWNLQAWFRDPAHGGQFANLSDRVELLFH